MERKGTVLWRLGRWIALAALAWSAHTHAIAKQVEARPADSAMRSMSIQDCQPCAACYQGPAPAMHKYGVNDEPALMPSTWVTPLDEEVGSLGIFSGSSLRSGLALRVLYCRWLN